MKRAVFHPKAREVLRDFPTDVRREFGKLIYDLQKGTRLGPPVSRAMPSVARGVEELRVKDSSGAYRAFYYVKSAQGILVFHAFVKKAQKTPLRELRVARRRLEEMLHGKEN